jgi:hypothetical protein
MEDIIIESKECEGAYYEREVLWGLVSEKLYNVCPAAKISSNSFNVRVG